MYADTHAHAQTHTHTRGRVHTIHLYTHACKCTYRHVPHTHAHTRTFKYMHTNARTHTHNLRRYRFPVTRFEFFRIAWKDYSTIIVQGTSIFFKSKERDYDTRSNQEVQGFMSVNIYQMGWEEWERNSKLSNCSFSAERILQFLFWNVYSVNRYPHHRSHVNSHPLMHVK